MKHRTPFGTLTSHVSALSMAIYRRKATLLILFPEKQAITHVS